MHEIRDILKRAELDNLISYLIYDSDYMEETAEDCEERIDESYEKIFDRLEDMYVEANREDDRLFEAVNDFATLHDEVYFKTGVLTGFRLYQNMELGYKKYAGDAAER